MPTLRQRFRHYRQADGFPETPEDYDPPRWVQLVGPALVAVVGLSVVLPIVVPAVVWIRPFVPTHVTIAMMASTFFAGMLSGKYIGAPVADHILGVPREVSES